MIEVLLGAVFSLAVFALSVFVYTFSAACIGLLLGFKVDEVSVGYGWGRFGKLEWRGQIWKWSFGILPLGGFTKFRDSTDAESDANDPLDGDQKETGDVNDGDSGTRADEDFFDSKNEAQWYEPMDQAHPIKKMLPVLTGPVCQILFGISLALIPIVSGGPHVELTERDQTDIQPVAVSGIGISDSTASLSGQFEFGRELFGQLVRKYLLFQPLEGWGGFIGCFTTLGAAMSESILVWCTCAGVLIAIVGVFNLLPIPVLNGFHLLVYFKELFLGKGKQEALVFGLTLLGFIYLLIVMIRGLVADFFWLTG